VGCGACAPRRHYIHCWGRLVQEIFLGGAELLISPQTGLSAMHENGPSGVPALERGVSPDLSRPISVIAVFYHGMVVLPCAPLPFVSGQ